MLKNELQKIKEAGVKFIYTVHNLTPHEESKIDDIIHNFILYAMDEYVVFSERQKQVLLTKYNHICREKVTVIPHMNYWFGVTRIPKMYWHHRLSIGEKDIIVLLAGRLRAYKNYDIFLDACKHFKNTNIKFVVAGLPYNQKVKQDIIDRVSTIENARCILEFLSEELLVGLIAESSVVAIPYEAPWTTGVGVLAGNLGVPLMGTMPTMFADLGVDIGYMQDSGNITTDQFCGLVENMVKDKDMRLKGCNFKQELLKNTDSKIGKLYLELYSRT